jgi:predicted methyltransferase
MSTSLPDLFARFSIEDLRRRRWLRRQSARLKRSKNAPSPWLLLAALGMLCSSTYAGSPPTISEAVADTSRPREDTVRDKYRKPADVLAFAGVKPGMVIAELVPGGGYYTRILAKAVGPKGKVYAISPAAVLAAFPGYRIALNAIASADGNVQLVESDLNAIILPEKVDMVWTTENYHDLHIAAVGVNIPALDKSVYESLKPGGVFIVEDHSAKAGAPADVTYTLHRIDEDVAKREFVSAGFRVAGESNVLRNASDDRQTLSFSDSMHDHTDRFLLRLQRP